MSFSFCNGQHLRICGHEFQVLGGVEFRSGSDTWQEYCLADARSRQNFWLSIAREDDEYAIYHSEYDKDQFTPQALRNAGYHEVDRGRAEVINVFGAVDVEIEDQVSYVEYEDSSENNIMSIEHWDDEVEFSSGYYLDFEEIEVDGMGARNPWSGYQGNYHASSNAYSGSRQPNAAQQGSKFIKIILIVFVCLFAFPFVLVFLLMIIAIIFGNSSDTPSNLMSKQLADSPMYRFEQEVVSDLNAEEKAKLYSSEYAVDGIVADLIAAASKKYEPEVQPNGDDSSVTILTPDEYAIVYKGDSKTTLPQENVENLGLQAENASEVAPNQKKKTYIQVSSRAYAYESSNKLLHASDETDRHYRDFYYLRAYHSDRSRYSSRRHRYNDYRPILVYSPSNHYQSYAKKKHSEYRKLNSTRTSSRSRSSSSSRRMGK